MDPQLSPLPPESVSEMLRAAVESKELADARLKAAVLMAIDVGGSVRGAALRGHLSVRTVKRWLNERDA
jgi:hypothetical protein